MSEFDTSAARAAIFERIRTNQKRGPAITDGERDGVNRYLAEHPVGPQPAIGGDLRIRFRAMSERQSCSVDEVATPADVPAAVARYLAARDLGAEAVVWPSLAALDWSGAGLSVQPRPPRRDETAGGDPVGITGCFCAIAETGTLMLLSGPPTPATVSLLPETHIALVPVARIVATMEDAFALLRAEHGELPRAVNFISGPSRTGDIEQTIVLGAHGPCRVHLILIGEAS